MTNIPAQPVGPLDDDDMVSDDLEQMSSAQADEVASMGGDADGTDGAGDTNGETAVDGDGTDGTFGGDADGTDAVGTGGGGDADGTDGPEGDGDGTDGPDGDAADGDADGTDGAA